jgi:hypothetical protein
MMNMSLNPGGAGNYSWNYSKPEREGYSTQLVGTVVAIQEVQKMGYTTTGQPGAPEFWPDGNPKMNIRLALVTEQGELKTFTFQPASKQARAGQKKSVHMDLFHLTGDTDMMNLIGRTLCISTKEGHYGQGNPRPWFVQLVDAGPFQLSQPLPPEFKLPQVLANSAVSGGRVQQPQAQQPQYQQQYQPAPQYQQPVQQQQYQPVQQPQYQQQPMYPQVQQPMYQQPQQQYPQMDPQIAQAMASQVFGGPVSVEQVPPQQPANPVGSGEVYDEDMPF